MTWVIVNQQQTEGVKMPPRKKIKKAPLKFTSIMVRPKTKSKLIALQDEYELSSQDDVINMLINK